MELIIPPMMITLASQLGAQLPATMQVDEYGPLMELQDQLPAGADFGCFGAEFGFGPLRRVTSALKKAVPKAAGGAVKVKSPVTVAFGIKSSAMPMQQAMAAADRLLRDPRIANAQTIVKNTQALAALGDPSAKRGIITLQAVGQMRNQLKAKPGQAVIPTPAPAARNVTIARSTAQVKRMAVKAVAPAQTKPGIIKRVITWFKTTF